MYGCYKFELLILVSEDHTVLFSILFIVLTSLFIQIPIIGI